MIIYCSCCNTAHSSDDLGTVCRNCCRGVVSGPDCMSEFPEEYWPTQNEIETLQAAGFEDDSWHNNICPSFTKACTFHGRPDGTTITIWVDAINPTDREMTAERFMVAAYEEMEMLGEGFYTDSLAEALEVAAEVFAGHEAGR